MKAYQLSKGHAGSQEITNELCYCTGSNYECTDKLTTDLKANYDWDTLDVEKSQEYRHKRNFEDEANNKQLDKENTQRSNLNNEYLSKTPVLKYPDYFICFLLRSTDKLSCKGKLDIALRSPSKPS